MSYPYFDAHCDTVSACRNGGQLWENQGQLDLKRLGQYRPAGQIFAIYHDAQQAPPDGMFAECRRQYELFLQQMQKNAARVAFCPDGSSVEMVNNTGLTAALLSIEGADLIDCDPDKFIK